MQNSVCSRSAEKQLSTLILSFPIPQTGAVSDLRRIVAKFGSVSEINERARKGKVENISCQKTGTDQFLREGP